MKKIYMSPKTDVVKVGLTTMIAASDPVVSLDPDVPAVDPETIDSRSFIWDDDDDFDYNF